jgi:ParB-like chromosome segregation protein Spo0J
MSEDLKIIQRKPHELKPAEYNPRQLTEDQHAHLRDSILTFGLVDPIIVNSNPERKDIVIGGHQRLRIAEELNMEYVPVIELNLSLEEERELNIRLNKNTGSWDWDTLANEFDMQELKDWGFQTLDFGVSGEPEDPLIDDDSTKKEEKPLTECPQCGHKFDAK